MEAGDITGVAIVQFVSTASSLLLGFSLFDVVVLLCLLVLGSGICSQIGLVDGLVLFVLFLDSCSDGLQLFFPEIKFKVSLDIFVKTVVSAQTLPFEVLPQPWTYCGNLQFHLGAISEMDRRHLGDFQKQEPTVGKYLSTSGWNESGNWGPSGSLDKVAALHGHRSSVIL